MIALAIYSLVLLWFGFGLYVNAEKIEHEAAATGIIIAGGLGMICAVLGFVLSADWIAWA